MDKAQLLGVQALAIQRFDAVFGAVHSIPCQRMPRRGHVYTNLMGAPHMDNAKKFVDYMLGEKCQSYVGKNLTVRPLRADAELNDSLTPWDNIVPLDSYDGEWVAANKASITEKYSEYLENFGG